MVVAGPHHARSQVGEEMTRQPSLPSLTNRGNPGADLAFLAS